MPIHTGVSPRALMMGGAARAVRASEDVISVRRRIADEIEGVILSFPRSASFRFLILAFSPNFAGFFSQVPEMFENARDGVDNIGNMG